MQQLKYVNLHEVCECKYYYYYYYLFQYLPLDQKIANKIRMVGKLSNKICLKSKFSAETVGLYCGILVTLAILIISKVISEEMMIGHHSKRHILER